MDRLVLHESLVLHERPGESTPSQLASSHAEPTAAPPNLVGGQATPAALGTNAVGHTTNHSAPAVGSGKAGEADEDSTGHGREVRPILT